MATTHREHLPGAYPDSNPATPNEQSQAPLNQSSIHDHSQRHRLHKSTEPRGAHNFSDSGIHSQPIENKSDVTQRQSYGHSSGEAVGGGFYHGNEPTMFNSQQPRVSEVQRSFPMENTDREATFGDQHEYTFSKPVPATAKEQGFREVDAHAAPEQGLREANSHLAADSRHEFRRPSGATSSPGVDEQLSNVGEKSSNDDATSRTSDTSAAAPYWGDLPKASQGGIYNTVTGHGSARDDHDEHHHLPERSAEDSDNNRAHIKGLGTDVPSGGVYNTIAGHGSNDEESRRHLDDNNNNNNNDNLRVNEPACGGAATINSTDAVFDAPLAAVPEEKTLPSDSFSQMPANAPGFMPELTAGDDAKLLAASNAQKRSAEPVARDDPKLLAASAAQRKSRADSINNADVFDTHAQDRYQKDSTASRGSVTQNSDLKTQRAFPLTAKHATTADVAMVKEDENKHPLRHKEAFAAGAAGLGVGAAASHMAKQHQEDELRDIKDRDAQKNLGEDTLSKEWDTVPENLDHPARNYPGAAAAAAAAAPSSHRRKSQELDQSGVIPISGSTLEQVKTKEEEKPLGEDTIDVWDTTPENLQKPASSHTAHAAAVQQPAGERRLEKEPSPAESRSSEDSTSKGEKKHRGLLGIFHRHKDDKEEDTATTEPPKSPKSPKDKGRNKLQKKDAALAGAGAAAGYGLAHHHKDDKDAPNQAQRKSFSGPAANQPTELDQKRRASEAAPVSHRRNPSDAESKIPSVPAVGAVSTGASPHAPSQAQREHAPASKIPVAADHNQHDKLNSNTARAGMAGATLAGVAGGIGAVKYASAQDDKKTVEPDQDVSHVGAPAATGTGPVIAGGLYHTENPKQAPTDLEHPKHAPSPPAQHAADFSANPIGVKPNEKLARNTAQEPGYNMLMSGTPSGAQPFSTHEHGSEHTKTTNEPGNYNKLASGTPSGVDTTAPLIKDTENKRVINPADHMIMTSGLPSHKSEKQQGTITQQQQQPDEYNHLNTGTPSGVAIDNTNVGRARSEDHPRNTQQSGDYKHLATGIPSGVNTGATTSKPSARRASEGVKRNDSEEGPYNHLASGTPSGVKISPHHSRRSSRATGPAEMTEPVTHYDQQDKDGIYPTLASGTTTGINVAAMHHNRDKAKEDIKHDIHEQQSSMNAFSAKAPVQQHQSQHAPTPVVRSTQYGGPSESETATNQGQRGLSPAESQSIAALPTPEQHSHKSQIVNQAITPHHATTGRRTQDQYKPVLGAEPPQQFMSPEVMPDAYTTSVPGRNSGAVSGPNTEPATTHPMHAKHMSPEEMPSAYTASAPGHSGAEKINSIPQSTGHSFGVAAPQPREAKYMSPEEMPSSYTTSAADHSGTDKLGQSHQDKFNTNLETAAPRSAPTAPAAHGVNPALAGASGAWAASSLGHGGNGQGGSQSVQNASGKQHHISKPVLHKCQHCGQDNDIGDLLETVIGGRKE